jgi:hypothetical protein
MAEIEIVKIIQRKGLKVDLPTLDEGELGFATDTKELFIGSGTENVLIAKESDIPSRGSTVTDSSTNGSVMVDGVELLVYDDAALQQALNSKADTEHPHFLADLIDVDVTDKTDGHALLYDSAAGKFVSKALPSGNGGGVTDLDGLSDVEISNIPVEGNILQFQGGVWKPGTVSELYTTDLSPGELIELKDTTPPVDVPDLQVATITQHSVALKWSLPASSDIQRYNVYQDAVLIKTLGYIERSVLVTGLDLYTDYIFKVTGVDDSGNESTGVEIQATTLGKKLKMNGFPGTYLKTPELTFNEMVMKFKVEKEPNKYYVDGRIKLSLSNFHTNGELNESVGAFFQKVYLNDVLVPSPNSSWLPHNQEVEVRLLRDNPNQTVQTGAVNIFANYSGSGTSHPYGEIARVRFYNQGTLVADYNFQKGTYADQSGNGHELVYTSGNFI